MKLKKPTLIIVEGAQGVGKGTITKELRNELTCTNLYSLSGLPKTASANNVKHVREAEMESIAKCCGLGINFILDRSFVSEKVYCNLGLKSYDFIPEYYKLTNRLQYLSKIYSVFFIVLVASEDTFIERLKRDKPEYEGINFSAESSLAQQNQYLIEMDLLAETIESDSFHTLALNTDNKSPKEITDILLADILELQGIE